MIKRIAWAGLMLLSAHALADSPAGLMARYAQAAGGAVAMT